MCPVSCVLCVFTLSLTLTLTHTLIPPRRTPGHPENFATPGVEVSTGPLGQGFANAVGLATAEAHLAATFNRPDGTLFDNYTYVLMGDGCMQEGVAAEAASLAGHLQLGKLIVFYDDNKISIDGETDLAFTEDVDMRFRAYGFHCQAVADGDTDLDAIDAAIRAAQAVTDRPSLIRVRTTIGKGSLAAGSEKVHGAPLGKDDVAQAKLAFGFDPAQSFVVPSAVAQLYRDIAARGQECEATWNAVFAAYARQFPAEAAEVERRFQGTGQLPADLFSRLPRYTPSASTQIATRKLSETLLNAVAPHLPELVGGSADLTGSNLTKWKESVDLQHPSTGLGKYSGRYIRFGVREHAMFAMCNGMAAFGGVRPFSATFLNFIGYGMGAVRLAALSHLPSLFIMTHDSIGLGEDGPTHQPIETLAALRATPNLLVLRPADGNEVSGAYWAALTAPTRPSVICLSRQNLPQLEGSSVEGVLQGAYVLCDFSAKGQPAEGQSAEGQRVVLVATGSEVALAQEAAELLRGGDASERLAVRIVSMPSWELFREQPLRHQQTVFPEGVPVVAIEAGASFGWREWAHVVVGIDSFGASGPYKQVYAKFGLTGSAIADKVRKTVAYYRHQSVPNLLSRPCE